VNIALYQQRFNEHLQSAKTHCQRSDYVQASEKVWGAISAFTNTQSKTECRSKDQKRTCFVPLLYKHLMKKQELVTEMQRLGFKGSKEIFEAAYDLHVFFYGGINLSDKQLSERILFLIRVLESL